jgi:actin-related protein
MYYPVSRGEINDYKHMKDIWSNLVDTQERNLSVLISDSPLGKKESKIETAKIMFELNV